MPDNATTTSSPPPPNLDFLFSAPLLDAALAQIKTLDQLKALQNTYKVAQKQHPDKEVIPDTIQTKLQHKERSLHETLVKDTTQRTIVLASTSF